MCYNGTYKGGGSVAAKPIENTERVSTFIPKELLNKLKERAAQKGMTVSGYIRLLIISDVEEK